MRKFYGLVIFLGYFSGISDGHPYSSYSEEPPPPPPGGKEIGSFNTFSSKFCDKMEVPAIMSRFNPRSDFYWMRKKTTFDHRTL